MNPDWRESKLGLRLIFWAWGAMAGSHLVQTLYRSHRFSSLFQRSEWTLNDLFDWSIPVFLQLVILAASVVITIGLWKLRRPIFLVASAVYGASILAHLPGYVTVIGVHNETLWSIMKWTGGVGTILGYGAIVTALVGFWQLAKELSLRIPIGAAIAFAVLLIWHSFYGLLWVRWMWPLVREHEQLWQLVSVGLQLGEAVLMLSLVDGLARAMDGGSPSTDGWIRLPGWMEAADGLRAYSSALMARIFVILGAMLLILFAAATGTIGFAILVAIGLPIATVIFSILMLLGIKRFAESVPSETEARPASTVALRLMTASALFDAFALLVLLVMMLDRHAIRHAQETADSASSAAMLLGIVGTFLLLGALRRVAHFMGNPALERRVRLAAILVAATTGFAGLFRGGAPMLRHVTGEIIGLIVLLLVLGVWALVVYLGILKDLRQQVLNAAAGVSPAALPTL